MISEEEAKQLYEETIHIDGLNICNFGEDIFKAWNKGGITAVSCTIGIWENFKESIDKVIQWKQWFEEYSDLIIQIHTTEDIHKAKKDKKTGVLLSWQNTAGIEDKLGYLTIFKELGVKKMQLTYNTQNYSGAGYVELKDSGLTGFGREVVDEMSKLGIVCDLSHVGDQTSRDVIEYAKKPPCFSHVLPAALKESGRNKSDELIKLIGEKGGFVGISQFGPHMPKGNDSTIDDYVDVVDYVISLIGEDLVGIGSDSSEGHGRPSDFMQWCNKDKGYARRMTPWGSQTVVKPLGPLAERHELALAMARKGWSREKMIKVLGLNWLNYLSKIIDT